MKRAGRPPRFSPYRFRDDVELVLDPDASVIHCRSASRVADSDFEANRQRIEAIRQAYTR